ncbi:MAG: hypothetical protein KDE22_12055 [Rhodobacterales bacterium]|nr:hypothetical protein [Rhodobacterales bacterium]
MSPPRGVPVELADIRAEALALAAAGADDGDLSEIELRKWRIIHRHLRRNPFHVPESLPRSEQWRKVVNHLRQTVDEPDLTDWLRVQVDVAANLAAGIRDMRPRKNGPCYDLVMEWVRDRKRKALAVLQWTRGIGTPKRPSFTDKIDISQLMIEKRQIL